MDLNEELKFLHAEIFGTDLEESRDPEEILKMLSPGKSDFILDLKWDEAFDDEYYDRHKIVLQSIDPDGRVFFYNPSPHAREKKSGNIQGGEKAGPARRTETNGIESVTREEFISFFTERDAICFVPVK